MSTFIMTQTAGSLAPVVVVYTVFDGDWRSSATIDDDGDATPACRGPATSGASTSSEAVKWSKGPLSGLTAAAKRR